MNKHPSPPINVLATALVIFELQCSIKQSKESQQNKIYYQDV